MRFVLVRVQLVPKKCEIVPRKVLFEPAEVIRIEHQSADAQRRRARCSSFYRRTIDGAGGNDDGESES